MKPPNAPLPRNRSSKTSSSSWAKRKSLTALRRAWERTLRALARDAEQADDRQLAPPPAPLSYSSPGGSVAVLGAPSSFAREFAEKKYAQTLTHLLAQHLRRAGHPGPVRHLDP